MSDTTNQRVTHFIVERKTWSRGEGGDHPNPVRLHRPSDGRKCCLGFYSLACGIPLENISDKPSLAQVVKDSKVPQEVEWLLHESNYGGVVNSNVSYDLMLPNDDPEIDDAEREAKLKEAFAQQGITVDFVDEFEENQP